MTAYTDDDVTAATKVITYHVNSPTYDDDVEIARAVLAAVAPAIAARALRQAAERLRYALVHGGPPFMDEPWDVIGWLRAEAVDAPVCHCGLDNMPDCPVCGEAVDE